MFIHILFSKVCMKYHLLQMTSPVELKSGLLHSSHTSPNVRYFTKLMLTSDIHLKTST